MRRLYVANLPYSVTKEGLERIFGEHGPLKDCVLVIDKETGRSRGFGFVEFESDLDALHAEEALNQFELEGRKIGVQEAQPRRQK